MAFEAVGPGRAQLLVYDETATLVGTFEGAVQPGPNVMALDLQGLAPGVYLYRLVLQLEGGDEARAVKKFVVVP